MGVGGGIAAFKAVVLVRELLRRGAEVRVVMTESATRFVGPITFTGLTGKPPSSTCGTRATPARCTSSSATGPSAIVVAPATANLLARAASGMADDALLATLSCADCPVLYAPAMHERMWRRAAHAAQRRALQRRRRAAGRPGRRARSRAASIGMGRMAEPNAIADARRARSRVPRGSDLARHDAC